MFYKNKIVFFHNGQDRFIRAEKQCQGGLCVYPEDVAIIPEREYCRNAVQRRELVAAKLASPFLYHSSSEISLGVSWSRKLKRNISRRRLEVHPREHK